MTQPNNHNQFDTKWSEINRDTSGKQADEKSLFVDIGNEPVTQRQLNLYHYFQFIKRYLEHIDAKDVIELGCGRGTISLYLAKYLGMNLSLMDTEEDAMTLAKDAFAEHNLDATFYTGDALDTGIADASFDATVSIGLAEHLDNVDDLFREQYRMLRPGGVMVSLNIPKKQSVQILNTLMRSVKKVFGSYKESVKKDYYRNELKPLDYVAFAEKAGFDEVEIMNVCPFPIYVPIKMSTDKFVTKINKAILGLRAIFMDYPYKTNYPMSQAHFLVAYKKEKKVLAEPKPLSKDLIQDGRAFVVAEIGKNFIQSEEEQSVDINLQKAKELVRVAKASGADAVKFQTHHVEDEVLDIEFDSPHFKGKNRHAWVKRNTEATPLETFWQPLKQYCDEIGITFFSTPMSRGAAMKLESLGQPVWKVASSDILDFVLLDYLASTGKTIFIPTGMSTIEEVDQCVNFLKSKNATFVLFHAVSRYPYPAEESQLGTITYLQERYPDIPIAFSQNSPWVEPAASAVAMGAVAVEQHFTLDRDAFGPDHKVSMEPHEFADMVKQIRAVEMDDEKKVVYLAKAKEFMGEVGKTVHEQEETFRGIFRKGLMAGQDIPAGTQITPKMLYAMRPASLVGGLPSEKYGDVVGKKVTKDLKKFDPITAEVFSSDSPELLVLSYHYIDDPEKYKAGIYPTSPELFRQQLETIGKSYTFIREADLVAAIRGEKTLPKKSCLITMDDGLISQYEVALPILEELSVPATLYIPTHHLEGHAYTVHKVHYLLSQVAEETLLETLENAHKELYSEAIDWEQIGVKTITDWYIYDTIPAAKFKYFINHVADEQRSRALVDKVFAEQYPKTEKEFCDSFFVTAEQLKKLHDHPLIDLGLHTYRHESMVKSSVETVHTDIVKNDEMLKDITGKSLHGIAYPYGSINQEVYTEKIRKPADEVGLVYGFTTEKIVNTDLSQPFLLGRFGPNDITHGKRPVFEIR